MSPEFENLAAVLTEVFRQQEAAVRKAAVVGKARQAQLDREWAKARRADRTDAVAIITRWAVANGVRMRTFKASE